VDHGGFFFFPGRDLVIVVHYEPAGTAAADVVAAALADALDGLTGGPLTDEAARIPARFRLEASLP
jgi:hypothetical protein